ncbi:unnamed protein product [Ectocarpus sp. 12 AP-2014]
MAHMKTGPLKSRALGIRKGSRKRLDPHHIAQRKSPDIGSTCVYVVKRNSARWCHQEIVYTLIHHIDMHHPVRHNKMSPSVTIANNMLPITTVTTPRHTIAISHSCTVATYHLMPHNREFSSNKTVDDPSSSPCSSDQQPRQSSCWIPC